MNRCGLNPCATNTPLELDSAEPRAVCLQMARAGAPFPRPMETGRSPRAATIRLTPRWGRLDFGWNHIGTSGDDQAFIGLVTSTAVACATLMDIDRARMTSCCGGAARPPWMTRDVCRVATRWRAGPTLLSGRPRVERACSPNCSWKQACTAVTASCSRQPTCPQGPKRSWAGAISIARSGR